MRKRSRGSGKKKNPPQAIPSIQPPPINNPPVNSPANKSKPSDDPIPLDTNLLDNVFKMAFTYIYEQIIQSINAFANRLDTITFEYIVVSQKRPKFKKLRKKLKKQDRGVEMQVFEVLWQDKMSWQDKEHLLHLMLQDKEAEEHLYHLLLVEEQLEGLRLMEKQLDERKQQSEALKKQLDERKQQLQQQQQQQKQQLEQNNNWNISN